MQNHSRMSGFASIAIALAGLTLTLFCFTGALRVGAQVRVLSEQYDLSTHFTLQTLVWLLIFVSGAVTGIALVVSAIRRRPHNLVPGPTLYFLGAGLLFNGIILLADTAYVWAIGSLVAGAVLVYLESNTEIA